jgi:hypothetical protein
LDVSAGGLLGVGKKHFLVLVEDVKRDMDGERVTVVHSKDKVMESPEFDPMTDSSRTYNVPSTLLRSFVPDVNTQSASGG